MNDYIKLDLDEERVILKVPTGQDPYTVIGQYIRDHMTAIEDIIATIELDGHRTNELFMADMEEDGYFVWQSDWWEGEKNIALIDFFPVSEAKPERENYLDRITKRKVYLAADKVLEIIECLNHNGSISTKLLRKELEALRKDEQE